MSEVGGSIQDSGGQAPVRLCVPPNLNPYTLSLPTSEFPQPKMAKRIPRSRSAEDPTLKSVEASSSHLRAAGLQIFKSEPARMPPPAT